MSKYKMAVLAENFMIASNGFAENDDSIVVSELMEIDETFENAKKSDIEDGEVTEEDDDTSMDTGRLRSYQHPGGFTTGVDITQAQEKLGERAKRFGLNSNELKSLSDDALRELYYSLGITEQESRITRFDTIHIRGTEDMSTEDLFDYFSSYGPASIEWINDCSCNIVWSDKVSAVRALQTLSKPIIGIQEAHRKADPFTTKSQCSENKIKSADVQVMVSRLEGDDGDVIMVEEEVEAPSSDNVHVSDIKIPIPPGMWRFAHPHPKAKSLLVRFANKNDRKCHRAERFSKYYKKYGNPNFGFMKGVITDSKRKSLGWFTQDHESKSHTENKKNPWGDLAENWEEDNRHEPEYTVKRKAFNTGAGSVLNRIGIKLKREHDETLSQSSGSSSDEWTTRIKIPRMKMYADKEQKRINKMKMGKLESKDNFSDDVDLSLQVNIINDYISDDESDRFIRYEPVASIKKKTNIKSRLGSKMPTHSLEMKKTTSPRRNKERNRTLRRQSYSDSDTSDLALSTKRTHQSVIKRVQPAPAVRPTLASAVSRRHSESRRNNTSESNYSSSEDEANVKSIVKTKSSIQRPGFDKADLRSRLRNKSLSLRSNVLQVEIDNSYYNDS